MCTSDQFNYDVFLSHSSHDREVVHELAERLKAAGYETYGRTDEGFLIPAFGFARGFDVFDYRRYEPQEHQRVGWSRELARHARSKK